MLDYTCSEIEFVKQPLWTRPGGSFSSVSVAAFPSTYFYARFRISHKKTLDGNGKMRINSKNVHKKVCAHLSRINLLSGKKKFA